MDRTLQLVSKTSNEIFMLRYPRSVLNFCDYDLAYFAENAIAACNDALKNGETDTDRISDLRSSIKNAHVFIEHHLRTTYDKIVLDCWIDYVCRRDNVGTASLWNRFMGCRSAFEREVFSRLCDLRYNRAINEWLNLVRVQDYARNKISFVFSKPLTGADEAAARRNYFDLMFSVTAQELGCRTDELGVTKVFTLGRVPSAPFMFPMISKDIIKNLLSDLDYSEDYSNEDFSPELSDNIAMDAFAHMKHGLAQEFDSYNITRSRVENASSRVYMPCGLKAAVDLEIDALIESGGWLSRCKRCGRYFLRDSEHTQEYCSLMNPGGLTCLEIYEKDHPKDYLTPELERACSELTDMMYARIDKDMELAEYESWKVYLDALSEKVKNGEIPPDELREFLRYSRSMDLSRSKPVTEIPKKEQPSSKERVVKPFVPERIQRSEIAAPKKQEDPEELEARREGFFTSPSVQRQKSERTERGQISHIIRAGERPPEPAVKGFVGFAESRADSASETAERSKTVHNIGAAPVEAISAQPARFNESDFAQPYISAGGFVATDFSQPPVQESRAETAARAEAFEPAPPQPEEQPKTESRQRVIKKNAAAISAYGKMTGAAVQQQGDIMRQVAAPQLEQVSRPEAEAFTARRESAADPDPFKDIGSIFDVLEQSDSDMSDLIPYEDHRPAEVERDLTVKLRAETAKPAESAILAEPTDPVEPQEPSPEWEPRARREKPAEKSSPDRREPPSGFWTEERHLFPNDSEQGNELAMLKEKKRGRTSKTRHLYEALMKEPEDNPTIRKKR